MCEFPRCTIHRMLNATREQIGPLQCIVIDGSAEPTIAVVICHGYGASDEDLAPLASEWLERLGSHGKQFRFLFPDAPHSLAELGMPSGRAWWPINMARLAEAVQASRFDDLHDEQPPGIDEVRSMLCETIDEALGSMGGKSTPLVLGGFSQGAMLTMDASLRGSISPPQWLFQFSGTVVCRPQWQTQFDRLKQTRVFQSHGKVDPILPYSSAEVLRDLLVEAGVDVEFHSFMGPHTIDAISIDRTAEALATVAQRQ